MASAEAATATAATGRWEAAAAGDAEQQLPQNEEVPLDSARSDASMPEDCISPNSDVFSYFMMTSPNELIKHHRFTVDAMMSYLLVFMVLTIQGVLLYCVYNQVIMKNADWHHGIMNTGHKGWNIIQPKQSGCNTGNSLCTLEENGMFTCAPPSVQLIGRWDELDTNKDGEWSKHEAVTAQETLQCKYGVNPVEIFDALTLLLKERKEFIWLHPDIKEGIAIKKTYFTYIMGDMAMCTYRNEDMCANLVQNGVFDAPLKTGKVPRVGTSIRSALDYCRSLLDQGGLCERVLPSTYRTWQIEGAQECGEAKYDKFVYEHPGQNGTIKSLLSVDYDARQQYEKAKTGTFKMYKICILFVWMLLNVSQLREVWKTMTWVIQLPTRKPEEDFTPRDRLPASLLEAHPQGEEVSDSVRAHGTCPIKDMSKVHRIALFSVTLVRIVMLCILSYVGVNFLGRQTDYIGLLLDGVALIFIVEVEVILYERVLRQEVRSTWEEREPIAVSKKFGLASFTSRPDITDMAWFFLVAFMAVAFLFYYTETLVEPLYEALECTCLSTGDKCREAHVFSSKFWDQYWLKDVPTSIQEIKGLKGQFYALVETGAHKTARAAGNLLKYHHSSQHAMR